MISIEAVAPSFMSIPNHPDHLPSSEGILVENHFVRERNVLLASADLSSLFVDYYLHLQQFGLRVSTPQAELFKAFLAGFTLHAASRPRNEVIGWTIHIQDPSLSIFLGANTGLSTVTGRLFTEGLKKESCNMFYQELVVRDRPLHRSIVPFEGNDPKTTIEFYYNQSEQRPGKFFHLGDDHYALATAHPDWDRGWFRNLDPNRLSGLDQEETLSRIEARRYRWFCGCHYRKILGILHTPMQQDPEALFGEDLVITVNCPRCAGRYRISREAMEAYLAESQAETR